MTDIGEMISLPVEHKEPSKDCPFCPPPEPLTYTTYPGAKNNSKKLAEIMENPEKLTSSQPGARPQTGKSDSDGYTQEQEKPRSRKQNTTKPYTFQAHHLISGNQALKGSPMEDWILASDRNEKDTGYSVNSTGNGFWAPSVPKDYVGKWSAKKKVLTDAQRQSKAEEIMRDARAQIHIGPHNITDPDDSNGGKHKSYDQYIKARLEAISDRINAWSNVCYLCDSNKKQDKKPQANYTVHDVLDRLSNHLQRKISGSPKSWKIFISKYALEYHKSVGPNIRRKK